MTTSTGMMTISSSLSPGQHDHGPGGLETTINSNLGGGLDRQIAGPFAPNHYWLV
jgi:hypothetical protein